MTKQADLSINRQLDDLATAALILIVIVPLLSVTSKLILVGGTPVTCMITVGMFVVFIASLFDSIEKLDAVA